MILLVKKQLLSILIWWEVLILIAVIVPFPESVTTVSSVASAVGRRLRITAV